MQLAKNDTSFWQDETDIWTNVLTCISLNNGEIWNHVHEKQQTSICTTWPRFPFPCRLIFNKFHATVLSFMRIILYNFPKPVSRRCFMFLFVVF